MTFVAGAGYSGLPQFAGSWVIQDLLPAGGLLNIFGQPKQGKSFLALQFAQGIADPSVDEVLGFPILSHGPVAYLQIDTPRSSWAERLSDLMAAGYNFDNVFFADTQMVPYPFNILGEGHAFLKQNLARISPYPLVLIVDTIRESHAGDENDSGHMRNVVNLFVDAVRPASLIFVSHARKEWNQGDAIGTEDLMSENRGSGYVSGRMDCVLKVTDAVLSYQGRTVGKSRVTVKREDETGFFTLSDDFDRIARTLMQENPEMPAKALAKLLQERYPRKSLEACRSMIRRLQRMPGRQPQKPGQRIIALENGS